jgi:hypothetical protein
MTWLRFSRQHENFRKDRLATANEIRMVLDAEHDYLYWIALLITGDAVLANKCLVDVTGLSTTSCGVFHEWLSRWARTATARIAASSVRDVLVASSQQYATSACEHASHELLSEERVEFIRCFEPQQVISKLDPFSRAILVLRGIQGLSISDCALSIEVPRRCVIGAYCRALRWVAEEAHRFTPSASSGNPLLEILDGEE